MSTLARLPGLDGLRGVAVLAVMGYHLNLGHFLPAGFLGVDIFFTVSGFIITALLLQEHARTGRIDFAAFYMRRARRLFPAALVMLLAVVALTPLLSPAALSRLVEDLPAAFLYLSNWWQIVAQQSYFEAIEHPRLLQHLWSLAVEEQYYLLWPLLFVWLLRPFGKTGLGLAAGFIAVASTAWMTWLFITHIDGGDPSRIYLGTDTHLMGLLTGSALAAWSTPFSPVRAKPSSFAMNSF
jgi:peptidoglycan/LPS O-acetylase OafA/YrhL